MKVSIQYKNSFALCNYSAFHFLVRKVDMLTPSIAYSNLLDVWDVQKVPSIL